MAGKHVWMVLVADGADGPAIRQVTGLARNAEEAIAKALVWTRRHEPKWKEPEAVEVERKEHVDFE